MQVQYHNLVMFMLHIAVSNYPGDFTQRNDYRQNSWQIWNPFRWKLQQGTLPWEYINSKASVISSIWGCHPRRINVIPDNYCCYSYCCRYPNRYPNRYRYYYHYHFHYRCYHYYYFYLFRLIFCINITLNISEKIWESLPTLSGLR